MHQGNDGLWKKHLTIKENVTKNVLNKIHFDADNECCWNRNHLSCANFKSKLHWTNQMGSKTNKRIQVCHEKKLLYLVLKISLMIFFPDCMIMIIYCVREKLPNLYFRVKFHDFYQNLFANKRWNYIYIFKITKIFYCRVLISKNNWPWKR